VPGGSQGYAEGETVSRRGSTIRTYFLWPDTHAPYHDVTAVNVALAAANAIEPDELIMLGDGYDFYAVSFYGKDPRRKFLLQDEIDEGRPVWDAVDELGVPVTVCEGNHELRLSRYIREKAPALDGLVRSARDAFPADWGWVPYGQSHRVGKALVSHDFGRCGINAARQGLIDVGANIAFGHTHGMGIAIIGQQRGSAHSAMACGWLGSLDHIDYRHAALAKRTYQHGFGIIRVCTDTGNVWMTPVPIVKNECVVDGRRVRV
jgi:hypothetical protein